MNQGHVPRGTFQQPRERWTAERIRISVDRDMRDALQDYAQRHGLTTGQAVYRLLELWRAGR